MKRLLQISDKVSGSRWKFPTQPVSSRNKWGSNSFQRYDDPLICIDEEKNVVTKLGWVFCFRDLFFHLTLKSVKRRNVKTKMFYF